MQTLVIYDISDDKLRTRMEALCRNFGMRRIQKSAFLGLADADRRQELLQRTRQLMAGMESYDVRIFPMCATDFDAMQIVTDTDPEPPATELEQLGIVIV